MSDKALSFDELVENVETDPEVLISRLSSSHIIVFPLTVFCESLQLIAWRASC